jgi:hypothetical protein
MSKRLAVVPSPPRSADPTRLQLAAAIKAAAKTKAALAAHQAAITRAGEQLSLAATKVEQARAGIDAARHAFAGEMADALAAGRAIPATSSALKMADAAVTDAERTASAVGVARDRLRSDLRNLEIDVSIADLGIIAEVNKLGWPSLEAVIERIEASLAIAISGFALFSFLNSSLGAGANERVYVNETGLPFSETQRISAARQQAAQRIPPELQERVRTLFALARVFCFPGDFHANANLPQDARALVDAWRSCREQLRRDSSAALPELPGA